MSLCACLVVRPLNHWTLEHRDMNGSSGLAVKSLEYACMKMHMSRCTIGV